MWIGLEPGTPKTNSGLSTLSFVLPAETGVTGKAGLVKDTVVDVDKGIGTPFERGDSEVGGAIETGTEGVSLGLGLIISFLILERGTKDSFPDIESFRPSKMAFLSFFWPDELSDTGRNLPEGRILSL